MAHTCKLARLMDRSRDVYGGLATLLRCINCTGISTSGAISPTSAVGICSSSLRLSVCAVSSAFEESRCSTGHNYGVYLYCLKRFLHARSAERSVPVTGSKLPDREPVRMRWPWLLRYKAMKFAATLNANNSARQKEESPPLSTLQNTTKFKR